MSKSKVVDEFAVKAKKKAEHPLNRKKAAARKRHAKQFLFGVLSLVFAAVLAFVGLQFEIRRIGKQAFRTVDSVPQSYTALVLGASVFVDLSPSQALKERLDVAVALYEAGKVQSILASGDHGTKDYDEVNTMRIYLLEQGIPADDIYLDHAGYDTYDSIYRAKTIYQVPSMIICTQSYHAYRAIYIAKALHVDAFACPTNAEATYRLNYDEIRESLARVKAFFETQIRPSPPVISDDVVPITERTGTSTWEKKFD